MSEVENAEARRRRIPKSGRDVLAAGGFTGGRPVNEMGSHYYHAGTVPSPAISATPSVTEDRRVPKAVIPRLGNESDWPGAALN